MNRDLQWALHVSEVGVYTSKKKPTTQSQPASTQPNSYAMRAIQAATTHRHPTQMMAPPSTPSAPPLPHGRAARGAARRRKFMAVFRLRRTPAGGDIVVTDARAPRVAPAQLFVAARALTEQQRHKQRAQTGAESGARNRHSRHETTGTQQAQKAAGRSRKRAALAVGRM